MGGDACLKAGMLKVIQLSELFKADVATGKKAYANSIGRQQVPDLYRHLEELDKEVERAQAAESIDPGESVVDRTKRIAEVQETRRCGNPFAETKTAPLRIRPHSERAHGCWLWRDIDE